MFESGIRQNSVEIGCEIKIPFKQKRFDYHQMRKHIETEKQINYSFDAIYSNCSLVISDLVTME